MKDKVISLNNGNQVFVVEEVNYLNRKFAFCNIIRDNNPTEQYVVLEVIVENDVLQVRDIQDKNIIDNVSVLITKQLQNRA